MNFTATTEVSQLNFPVFGRYCVVNQNVPSCVAAGTNNGCRPNPAYANNSQYTAAGSSNYHGLHVSLLQRPVQWGQYRVSYTLSRSMNDVGEFFFSSPIDERVEVRKESGRVTLEANKPYRLIFGGETTLDIQTSGTNATPLETAVIIKLGRHFAKVRGVPASINPATLELLRMRNDGMVIPEY